MTTRGTGVPGRWNGQGIAASVLSRSVLPRLLVAWTLVACTTSTTETGRIAIIDTRSAADSGAEPEATSASPWASAAVLEVPRPGQPSMADCRQPAEAYRLTSAEACLSYSFTCAPGEGAFVDACGCGCSASPFQESGPAWTAVDAGPLTALATECNGPSGNLALFDAAVRRLRLGPEEVFVLVGQGEEQAIWAVNKRDASLSFVTAGAASLFDLDEDNPLAVSTGGAVVDGASALNAGDGFRYEMDRTGTLIRTPIAGGPGQALFSVSGLFAFITFDGAYFDVTDDGLLSHAALFDEPVTRVALEQRGSFDDDDYSAIMGIDRDAVYWFAGSEPALRTSDGDPLALFRTCRP